MKSRRVPLIVGLVLAVGTGALLLGYLTSLRPSTSPGKTEAVLIATHDIPARAAVSADQFTVQQRIVAQVDPDAIGDPKELAGNDTLAAIPAGSIATRSKIGLASAATLPAQLAVGMRGATIAIDNVKGIAGLITPGDRVDVIAIPAAGGGEDPRGVAILRDVLVLAMGSDVHTTTASATGPLAPAPPALTTVTLELTPNQVDLIDGADVSSTLRLALRNPKEPVDAFAPEPLHLAGNAAPVAPQPAAAASPAPQAATRPATTSGVIVIDGDHVAGSSTTP